ITDTTCGYSGSFPVSINIFPRPNIQAAKSNDIDCANRSALLTATGASQYQWSSHPTLTSNSTGGAVVKPVVPTVYTVTGISAQGCRGTDTVEVKANFPQDAYALPNAFTPN